MSGSVTAVLSEPAVTLTGGITTLLSLTWGLLLCGAPCGCGLTSKTIPLLLAGVGLSCLICVLAWALGTLSLLAGGHGTSLICQPLHGHPGYKTLAELLDSGGILYGEQGFFRTVIGGNDTINIGEVLSNMDMTDKKYDEIQLKHALLAVRNGMNVATASKTFNVPRTTLRHKVAGRAHETIAKHGPDCVLGQDLEGKLCEWLKECARGGFPVTKDGLFYSVQKLSREIYIQLGENGPYADKQDKKKLDVAIY
ncbi:hypothetical protein NQ318_011330 [Aromia moschata]|uniref:HTH psq-type domain-containing protein n=1 Tax=Aromia moschata TaxID=1265417 RepID=A0AAV8XKH2_9CUCU|nr:hypothetical protein NQ318_011330 [Aromia moschata]